jgi:hypothetical protein
MRRREPGRGEGLLDIEAVLTLVEPLPSPAKEEAFVQYVLQLADSRLRAAA